jgi:hypothetical protein
MLGCRAHNQKVDFISQSGLSLGAGDWRNSTPIPPHCQLLKKKLKTKKIVFLSPSSVDCTYPINKMIKLTKKAIELLDAVTSVPYSRKGLGYTIGRGLDAVLPFTCYSYWFSCYFDQRGKLMKTLSHHPLFEKSENTFL